MLLPDRSCNGRYSFSEREIIQIHSSADWQRIKKWIDENHIAHSNRTEETRYDNYQQSAGGLLGG